ncbi:MAG: hypothetical protein WC326_15200 [Candidatus Delongbacteria bacterium]
MRNELKVPISDLPKFLGERQGAFLCCASFEERAKSVPASVKSMKFRMVKIFASTDCSPVILDTAEEIKSMFFIENSVVLTKMHEPLFTADTMARVVNELVKLDIRDVVIDITTFTHEMLLILLKSLHRFKNRFTKITCIYTGALEYSIGDPDERKWLSKGCKDIRSVLGFPGRLIPGRPNCLIVLVGFEHERATRMIVEMDPDLLLLGRGISAAQHLTCESHLAPMLHFHKLVSDMVSSRGSVRSFEFSCNDSIQTAQSLMAEIDGSRGYNHIIVPLNTKISTIAIANVALESREVQICYAEPETYNFAAYSVPDDVVSVFDIWEQ